MDAIRALAAVFRQAWAWAMSALGSAADNVWLPEGAGTLLSELAVVLVGMMLIWLTVHLVSRGVDYVSDMQDRIRDLRKIVKGHTALIAEMNAMLEKQQAEIEQLRASPAPAPAPQPLAMPDLSEEQRIEVRHRLAELRAELQPAAASLRAAE